MPQTAKVSALLSAIKTSTPDGGSGRVEQVLQFLNELSNGTGSNQADLAFIDEARAIADGATEDIDVAGGLTDGFNQTITAVEIVAIAIRNRGTTTLTIGGATAEAQLFLAAAGDKITLRAGEWFLAFSNTGWAIAAGSADDIRVANAAGAAGSFDFGVIARSA